MALRAGTRLGPYEIAAEIGAGGMGVVYRARDTRLQRDVAIKVLPDALAGDPDRLARFQREAQVLASLNHPSIAAIYGVEEQPDVVSGFSRTVHALVLELVEGETLADRIAQGPIPIDEALLIARQIAEALEAAHELGIIHRDLKPANIKIRRDGTVKVLDFGLAKLAQASGPGPQAPELTASPTITTPALMTGVGVLLGTAAYMSPEQARGKTVDKRGDIWAFGCVLYEMLTAKRAFDGEDMSDTLAFIITKEPEWAALPADAPHALRRLLRRCLEKDRKRRLADIADARLEIEEGLAGPARELTARVAREPARSGQLAWTVAAVLGGLLFVAVVSAIIYVRSDSRAPVYRATLLAPPDVTLTAGGLGFDRILAISPNGLHLAFSAAGPDGRRMLWVRRLDELSAEPLPGTENAQSPFWSPDSRWIAFFADGQLKKVEAIGGPVLTLCRYSGVGGGGTWNGDGVVLFSDAIALHRVDETGGTPSLVMAPDAESTNYQWPFFLPDQEHFVYRGQDFRTYVASLDSPEGRRLDAGTNNAQYAQGYLIWTSDGTLFAQRFDMSRLDVTDQPIAVAERVDRMFSLAQSGALVYQNAGPESSQLVWFDRAGRQIGVLGEQADYGEIELSPDSSQVAVTVRNMGQRDVWIVDVARGARTKFTFEPGEELNPLWSPGGERLMFAASGQSALDLYEKPTSGAGNQTRLSGITDVRRALSWGPDGRHVLYQDGQFRMVALPLSGDRQPVPLLERESTATAQFWARFAPNGRWIAYTSSESGRNEVYVMPFPGPGGKSLVSTAGGTWARWRRDGKELFYVESNGRLMAAEIDVRESSVRVGPVRPLFQIRAMRQSFSYMYDASPDGQRFLINTILQEEDAFPLTLIVNWPALLQQ